MRKRSAERVDERNTTGRGDDIPTPRKILALDRGVQNFFKRKLLPTLSKVFGPDGGW
jgi:hypothetical protein